MIRKYLLISLLLLLLVHGASAQAGTPLGQLLKMMPASAFSEGYLTYADYQALVASRPGVIIPTKAISAEELRRTPAGEQYFQTMIGIRSGFKRATVMTFAADQVAQSTGIQLPAIGQSAEAGIWPRQQVWMQGGIDAGLVEAALLKMGYQQVGEVASSRRVWCFNGDYVAGTGTYIASTDMTFFFGGSVGSRWPIMLDNQCIAAASEATIFQSIVSIGSRRLMDIPEVSDLYQALFEYSKDDVILQLYLLKPELVFSNSTPNPGLNALAIAHIGNPDASSVVIALHFSSMDDANAAKKVILSNIENAVKYDWTQEIYVLRNVREISSNLQEPLLNKVENGYVLLIPFVFPPQSEAVNDVDALTPFRIFEGMISRQEFFWMTP